MEKTRVTWLNILTAVGYLLMVTVNALANILPINGIGTGAVSDSYPNLFAPAGITFAIWGVIYILLGVYTLYQLGLLGRLDAEKSALVRKVNVLFLTSSVANSAWIFCWHYRQIGLSVLLMLVILGCLLRVALTLRAAHLTRAEQWKLRVPLSVYFGWITIATIANVTTLLVDLGWNRFGLSEPVWTVIILAVGLLITSLTTFNNRDVAYGLVPVWAYAGILWKHLDPAAFNRGYPQVIVAAGVSLVVLAVVLVLTALKKDRTATG